MSEEPDVEEKTTESSETEFETTLAPKQSSPSVQVEDVIETEEDETTESATEEVETTSESVDINVRIDEKPSSSDVPIVIEEMETTTASLPIETTDEDDNDIKDVNGQDQVTSQPEEIGSNTENVLVSEEPEQTSEFNVVPSIDYTEEIVTELPEVPNDNTTGGPSNGATDSSVITTTTVAPELPEVPRIGSGKIIEWQQNANSEDQAVTSSTTDMKHPLNIKHPVPTENMSNHFFYNTPAVLSYPGVRSPYPGYPRISIYPAWPPSQDLRFPADTFPLQHPSNFANNILLNNFLQPNKHFTQQYGK